VILIDSNILMYAAGASHQHKAACVTLLERVAAGDVEAALDAEVLQEILHRYRAIGRWESGRTVFDLARRVIPTVYPITAETLDLARSLLDRHPRLAARDALHAAVCQEGGFDAICSLDRDFDQIRGLKRLEPSHFR
jgi:predicted nucleic acid-binding protein